MTEPETATKTPAESLRHLIECLDSPCLKPMEVIAMVDAITDAKLKTTFQRAMRDIADGIWQLQEIEQMLRALDKRAEEAPAGFATRNTQGDQHDNDG